MLLNASHELTNCGLPQHIQERYVRYKQGNRAIVAWMTKYGPEKYKGKKMLPIKQMIALGNHLCEKVREIGTLPSDVDYYFKEVIKERSYLSQHFRDHRDQCEKDQVDTINHEHFTDSLEKIHAILLTAGKPSLKAKPRKAATRVNRSSSSTASISDSGQRISYMLLNEQAEHETWDDSNEDVFSDADTDATSECSHSISEGEAHTDEHDEDAIDFLDSEGKLDVAVEATIFLKNIEKIANAIKLCWTKTGKGETAVAAAAGYTNVLLVRAVEHVRSFHEIEPEQPTILDVKQRLKHLACTIHDHDTDTQSSNDKTLDGLAEAYRVLRDNFSSPNRTDGDTCSISHVPSSSSTFFTETDLMSTLVADLQTSFDHRRQSQLTFEGLWFLGGYETSLGANTAALASCTCLWLLATSHRVYSDALAKPNLIAMSRICALKLANEAVSTIKGFIDDKTIFPCQCVNTLGFRVAQMQKELEGLAKYRCWSSLMQSPLVSGNHILEIVDLCSYYGMHLFHYRHYVAAVLHTYQALTQLKSLDKIPILEEICDLTSPVLYTTGNRADSGFTSSWLRYIGARLKFRKGKRYQDHKDTWCMSVPPHAAARSAGLNIDGKGGNAKIEPKFDYGQIDRTTRLKHTGWTLQGSDSIALDEQLDDHSVASMVLAPAHSAQAESQTHATQRAPRSKHKRSKSCQVNHMFDLEGGGHDCSKLDHAFDAAFTVDASQGRNLPSSKLNLLAFFLSMTKVVSGISDTTHAEDANLITSTSNSGRGQMCLCFVQTILRAADRIHDVRKRSRLDAKGATWSKNEKECIECYKQHLMSVLEEAKVVDGSGGAWLWCSI